MSDYTKVTPFTPKDYLPVNDPEKLVVGAELDAEFDAIATMSTTKEDKVNKGAADGYAPLDSDARVPRVNLPVAVDYTDTAAQHTAGKGTQESTLTITANAVTPNCNLSNVFYVAVTGNITVNAPTNPKRGQVINIIFKQDATGSRTISFNGIYTFPSGGTPDVSTAANAVDMVSCQYDYTNTKWRCSWMKGFA